MAALLSLFYFFYFAIIGVYVIFMPKVLEMQGYTPAEIGIIFSAAPLVRFVVPFAFTRGLKLGIRSFHFALIVMVASSVAFYFSIENFYQLLFCNIALGIGLSLVLPYVELIALGNIGKERYGKVRLFGSVGFILVALVLVKYLSGAWVALGFMVILSAITALIAFAVASEAKTILQKTQECHNDITLLAHWRLWLGLTLMQVSFGAFYNFFTIYETNHGIALEMTIYLWSFGVIAEIGMLFFQGRLLGGNLLFLLQITTFASAFRWFLLFMFPQTLGILFFSQSLHALSFALFHSAAISYLYRLYKHKSLAQQFFSGITYGLGAFVGALVSGFVYESYPEYLFALSSLLALGAFGFLTLWAKTQERTRWSE
ncbi:MAG: MFS transporter [Sulfurimonadaceae bacterium]